MASTMASENCEMSLGISIRMVDSHEVEAVVTFFSAYLDGGNPALYSDEFLCPFGVRGAALRKSIIVCCYNENIVAACRFYRKKNGDISLYQFAVAEGWRKQRLLLKMISILNPHKILTKCPVDCDFNEYYEKTGWKLENKDSHFYYWTLSISLNNFIKQK